MIDDDPESPIPHEFEIYVKLDEEDAPEYFFGFADDREHVSAVIAQGIRDGYAEDVREFRVYETTRVLVETVAKGESHA